MPDSINLRPKQIKRLKEIYKKSPARVARRAHIVLLRNQKLTMEEIAKICFCDRDTVSDTISRFEKEAYNGLYDKDHPGRSCSLDQEDERFLLESLKKNPHDFGYFATNWTVPMMVSLLSDCRQKEVAESTVRSVLAKNNWHFGRPKHTTPTACPIERAEKDVILRLLTNPRPNEVVLFGDEADFEWLPYLSGAWMPKNEQLRVATPGKNQVLCCFGFFNPHNRDFFYKLVRSRSKKTAKNFIAMLHQLRSQFPEKIIHLVVDNASIHSAKTKILKTFCQSYQSQIVIHFLPKRSPILNPIERFWRFLKTRICANWLYSSLDDLIGAFRSFVWRYRESKIFYNFSLAKLISIWNNHPVVPEVAQAV